MAFELSLNKDRTYELLELTIANGARPVMIIEDPEGVAHDLFVELIFSERKDSKVLDYNDFVMDYAFDMEKIRELTKYCFVVIENVKFLYGKSATSKILADFAEKMSTESTAVIFIGKRITYDMAEFMEYAKDTIQYIIRLDSEE